MYRVRFRVRDKISPSARVRVRNRARFQVRVWFGPTVRFRDMVRCR